MAYKRLKKTAKGKGKSIKYIVGLQCLVSKPYIKLCHSGPDTLEKLEGIGKIRILRNKIFIR